MIVPQSAVYSNKTQMLLFGKIMVEFVLFVDSRRFRRSFKLTVGVKRSQKDGAGVGSSTSLG